MGKSNRQRKADKKRREDHRAQSERARSGFAGTPAPVRPPPRNPPPRFASTDTPPSGTPHNRDSGFSSMAAYEAMRQGTLGLRDRNAAKVEQAVGVLSRSSAAASVLSAELVQHVSRLWADGWQPADVVHVAGRNDDDCGALLSAVIAEESSKSCRPGRHVPAAWNAQLQGCGAATWRDVVGSTPVDRAMRRRGITQRTAVEMALQLLLVLMGLPRLESLLPPPSAWDKPTPASMRRASDVSEVDQRILAKVRGLLAKAESTTFPEEADALSSKAQEMMARYSIDHAMVDAAGASASGPSGMRVHLHDPYASAKASLLNAVARANRCKSIEYSGFGFCTVVGFPVDLEVIEVLYTSLLVQATRAVAAAGSVIDRSGRSRTRSFRQSFLISFAQRIGERLRAAAATANSEATETFGAALLPVLASRTEQVTQQFDVWFPTTRQRSSSISNRDGWVAGRAAADRANLGPNAQLPA